MKSILSAVIGATLALSAIEAGADGAPGERQVSLTIETDTLAAALDKWAQQSGFQIFVQDWEAAQNLPAKTLKGTFTAQDALEQLLSGTSLTYIWISDKAVSIRKHTAKTVPTALQRTSLEGQPGVPVAKFSGDGVDGPSTPLAAAAPGSDEGSRTVGLRTERVEEILVTGTHIRTGDPVGSPLLVYDHADIERSGVGSTAEFIETIPQNFSSDSTDSFLFGNSQNTQNASGVNLRGLGTSATLILVNGHRVAPGVFGYFVDVSAIPLEAIERVEILTDGASAIYGSDAVAGVVNFILRDEYQGAETTVRNAWISDSGAQDLSASQTVGGTWGAGNGILSVNYQHRDELEASDRDYAQVDSPYFLEPKQREYRVFGTVKQRLTDRLSVTADGVYADSRVTQVLTLPTFGLPTFTAVADVAQYSASGSAFLELNRNWALQGLATFSASRMSRDIEFPSLPDFNDHEFYRGELSEFALKADGPLFSLPAGSVGLAVGADVRNEEYRNRTDMLQSFGFPPGKFKRDVAAAFAELRVPIVSSENALAALRALTLSLAARYEDYSDAGNTLDPKFGLEWKPIDSLKLTASYSTSFNTARYLQTITTFNGLTIRQEPSGACPSGTCLFLYETGNQTDYEPETSRSLNFGFQFQPSSVKGLQVAGGYYEVRYEDLIGALPGPIEVLENAAQFPSIVTPRPSVAFVENFVERCTLTIQCQDLVGPFDPATVDYYMDLRTTNLAHAKTSGFDLGITYAWDTAPGRWDVGLGGTHALKFTRQLTPISPTFSGIDRVGLPAATRIRGNVGFAGDAFSIVAFANYVGGYANDRTVPEGKVSSWTTLDLRAQIPLSFGRSSVELNLAILNVLDEEPPEALDPFVPIGFDPTNANPDGRVFALEVATRW